MEHLQHLLDGSTFSVVSAFLLGLLTAISPCPLATNIAAVGYISKDIDCPRRIFFNGLLYTLGRILAYTLLGAVLIALLRRGAGIFAFQKTLAAWGEVAIAPVLILIGLFLLFGHRLNLPKFGFARGAERIAGRRGWGVLFLGMLFSMTFCPTSGVFYFGMLIPLAAAETGGYLLPAVFAVATGLPVVVVAWLLAYTVTGISTFYNRVQSVQKWLMRIVALLFLAMGIYYGFIYLF